MKQNRPYANLDERAKKAMSSYLRGKKIRLCECVFVNYQPNAWINS